MIIVPIYPGQGLGNQLWVYVVGRSIADETGRSFHLEGYANFKGTDFLDITSDTSSPQGDQAPARDPVTCFHERQFYDEELNTVCSGFDERVVEAAGSLRLEGLFQDERYFFGKPERLPQYIQPKPELAAAYPVAPDVCVLNIRGGEYKHHPALLLKKAYWENAMANMTKLGTVKRFVTVTDDAAYARRLFPDLPIVSGNVAACFMTILNARHVILSNSSFGYFPAKLGQQKTVIAPLHWARPDNALGRWASPANLYTDWLWQSGDGTITNYADLVSRRDACEQHYLSRYTVLIDPQTIPAQGWRRFVPPGLRRLAKAGLSRLAPSRVG
ncbi:MAG: hypothetical protein KKF14_03410 [Alphaproteobacteria bacterium]|nr:hypothetical protein [Alphaproteobacteria bacterium]